MFRWRNPVIPTVRIARAFRIDPRKTETWHIVTYGRPPRKYGGWNARSIAALRKEVTANRKNLRTSLQITVMLGTHKTAHFEWKKQGFRLPEMRSPIGRLRGRWWRATDVARLKTWLRARYKRELLNFSLGRPTRYKGEGRGHRAPSKKFLGLLNEN